MSDLNTRPAPAIADVYRDERLGLVRLAYLLTGARDHAEDIGADCVRRRPDPLGRAGRPRRLRAARGAQPGAGLHRRRYRRTIWDFATAMAGDGTLSGRLAGVPAADAYVAELGCTTG